MTVSSMATAGLAAAAATIEPERHSFSLGGAQVLARCRFAEILKSTPGAAKLGSCLTDATRGAAPGIAFV